MSAPRQCSHPLRRRGRCVICERAWNRARKRRTYPRRRPPLQSRRARWDRAAVRDLRDYYVRSLLSARHKEVPPNAWRPSMVELMRALIKLKRSIMKAGVRFHGRHS